MPGSTYLILIVMCMHDLLKIDSKYQKLSIQRAKTTKTTTKQNRIVIYFQIFPRC